MKTNVEIELFIEDNDYWIIINDYFFKVDKETYKRIKYAIGDLEDE